MNFPTLVCVDVETTGLTPELNEIIEIGLVRVSNGEIVETYTSLVHAERAIPPYVQYLTGITDQDLVGAPTFSDIAQEILAFIGTDYFVAHNVSFDLKMINSELARIGRPALTNPIFDSRDLGLILYPYLGSHKLSLFAEALGIECEASHRALADALSLAKIVLRMFMDLAGLHPLVIMEANRVLPMTQMGLRAVFSHFTSISHQLPSFDYKHYLPVIERSPLHQRPEIDDWQSELQRCFERLAGNGADEAVFERRLNQEALAQTIASAMAESQHAVLEAGTGIGKSIAYLIPAIYWALSRGKPVVIATKTKHLQHQLLHQDIATLSKVIPFPFNVALVKGKENFVDIDRVDELIVGMRTQQKQTSPIDYLALFRWLFWTNTGDLSELHPSLFQRFGVTLAFPRFKPVDYSRRSRCFVAKMRQSAHSAHVIITNHAMVVTDLAAEHAILPDHDCLIIDEAHTFIDAVSSAHTVRLSPGRVGDLLNKLTEVWADRLSEIQKEWQQLKTAKSKLHEQLRKLTDAGTEDSERGIMQMGITDDVRDSKQWRAILKTFEKVEQLLSKMGLPSAESVNEGASFPIAYYQLRDEIAALKSDMASLRETDSGRISWVERISGGRRDILEVLTAPVRCDAMIRSEILMPKSSVIFTSATVSVCGSLDYFVSQVGLEQSRRPVQLQQFGTEFDYTKQAIHARILGDESDVSGQIWAIVSQVGANSLVLFTSIKQMKGVYYRLRDAFKAANINCYCQQVSGTKETILTQFKAEKGRAVVFGVDSFWEGVDIAGAALQCVVMVKLPFPVPSDPLIQARQQWIQAQGGNGFRDYYLPLAVIKFKQGVGRLIRSKSDRGVLFVLDTRLYTQPYRTLFLKEIAPFSTVSGSLDEVMTAVKAHLAP